jgi:hypothetical protein
MLWQLAHGSPVCCAKLGSDQALTEIINIAASAVARAKFAVRTIACSPSNAELQLGNAPLSDGARPSNRQLVA